MTEPPTATPFTKPAGSDGSGGKARSADRPIESLIDDTMGRRSFAEHLGRDLLAAPRTGFVVALTGPWGSGKTSILNMVVDALGDEALAINFNPWMFSGTEALVAAFFGELSKQLRRKRAIGRNIAKHLATFGQLVSPLAGLANASGAVSAATAIMQQTASGPSVYEEHETLRRELAKLGKPVVVIVDDVDRLRPEEVRDIVRLVRLVGDFSNTIYLLAFDRRRVEECLGEGDIARGRAYLEKIVQITYEVPAAREEDLTALFFEGLLPLLEDQTVGPFVTEDWQNLFAFIIRPLLRTPRDVRRYLESLPMTLGVIGDEMALADLLALEAVRVLSPAMFDEAVKARGVLAPSHSLALDARGASNGDPNPLAELRDADPELASAIARWLVSSESREVVGIQADPQRLSVGRDELGNRSVVIVALAHELCHRAF